MKRATAAAKRRVADASTKVSKLSGLRQIEVRKLLMPWLTHLVAHHSRARALSRSMGDRLKTDLMV